MNRRYRFGKDELKRVLHERRVTLPAECYGYGLSSVGPGNALSLQSMQGEDAFRELTRLLRIAPIVVAVRLESAQRGSGELKDTYIPDCIVMYPQRDATMRGPTKHPRGRTIPLSELSQATLDGVTREIVQDELAEDLVAGAFDRATLVEHAERMQVFSEQRVEVRGAAQELFRHALLAHWPGCAFCGLTIRAALDAAHIVPWVRCDANDRVDVRNGLVACATHHRLFDAHVLQISTNLVVEYHHRNVDGSEHPVVSSLDEQPLMLPADVRCHPAEEFVRRRYEDEAK